MNKDLESYFNGKTLLITGGTGSFGICSKGFQTR